MKKTDKKIDIFKVGDWVSTTEIQPNPGNKYTNAYVKEVKKGGKLLLVAYGAYLDEKEITAKSCTLVRRI